MKNRVLSVCSILVILVGCSINPTKPQEKPPASPPPTQISSIEVPITVPYSVIEAAVNTALPQQLFWASNQYFDCPGAIAPCTWQVGINRNGPVTVSNAEKKLVFKVPIKTDGARVDINPGFKTHADAFVDVVIIPTVTFSLNEQWKLVPTVTVQVDVREASAQWKNISITFKTKLRELFEQRKSGIESLINTALKEKFDISGYATTGWNSLNGNFKINSAPATWLTVRPTAIMAEVPKGTSEGLRVALGIDAYLDVVAQDATPPIPSSTPLPPLQIVDTVTGKFNLSVPSKLSFNTINSTLDSFKGKDFVFDVGGKSIHAEIIEADTYGNGPDLVVHTKVRANRLVIGIFPLTVGAYVNGTPKVNPEQKTLRFDPFDYDIATSSLLLNKAEWYFHGKLKEELQGSLKVEYETTLNDLKATLSRTLETLVISDRVIVNGTVDTLDLNTAYVTQDGIVIAANASGRLVLRIK
ncbi:DUF4403 family protein [Oxalobacteraceae bacterium OTU3REALA1]|nr:DUF4403 family protein [Oxalobacteraceae bacterium OTU3REALA1]